MIDVGSNALQLAEEWGLPVFPVRLIPRADGKTDKRPLTEHGFKDATTNIEQINIWWQFNPDASVGVPTGKPTKIFLVDIDPAGEAWYRENQSRLECGRVHKTARGWHLVYRMPESVDIANSAGEIAPGVDVRGTGGFMLWWPATGGEYVGDMEDIKPAPQWLLEAIAKPPKATVTPIGGTGMIAAGRRNDFLSREAFRQKKLGATNEQIVAVLSALNETRCDPPVEQEELRKIAAGKSAIQPEPLTHSTALDADLKGVDLSEMHAHLTDSYVIKNFLPAQSEAWVLGMPGSGKTFFVTDMALHIANNISWMGRRVRGGLVVYVGAENARSVERRFTAARDNKPEFRRDAPLALTPGPLDLKSDASLEALMRFVRAKEAQYGQKCVLICVDTLSRAGGGKEDTEDFGACLRGSGRLKLELETSVLLIHHVGKDPSRGGRGWSGINGGVDLEVTVTEEGDAKVATVSKARDGEDGERFGFQLERVRLGEDSDGDSVFSCIVKTAQAPLQESKRPSGKHQVAILKEAEQITADHPGMTWTQTELMDLCKELEISASSARKAILNLRELGYFQPTIGGSKLSYVPGGKKEK